jgi:hypothetical protein
MDETERRLIAMQEAQDALAAVDAGVMPGTSED